MPKKSDKESDKLYQERLKRSALILELQKRGIYWNMIGVTPPKSQNENEK